MILALLPFAIIGLLFSVLTLIGLAINGKQCAIALDQWLATCFFRGAYADETISAACHRRQWRQIERAINWLFRDDLHCAKAYISELVGTQNNKEYRK